MPVQQHPIPQNVIGYQFRLVGDMTLKQFLQVGGGVIVALIIYATPLPGLFKWPLVGLAAGLGAAIAFLPVQGRPLDQWIIAFFKSIYSPTIYTWQKTGLPTPTLDTTPPVTTAPLPPTIKLPAPTTLSLERPDLVPKIHTLTRTEPPPLLPLTQPYVAEAVAIPRAVRTVTPIPLKQIQIEKQPRPAVAPVTPETSAVPTARPTLPTTPPRPGTQAAYAPELPIPHAPETPNTIVGMTLTPDGKILEAAIIEILKNDQTQRATRSNKLGQFLFAKPLENDLYQISAEKLGHTFPRFDLNLDGKIIPPIKLQALTGPTA